MVRVPKAAEVEWILDLNEEENELVRSEFYYEQVIAIKCDGHLSFLMMCSSMAGNAELGKHKQAFSCSQCNIMGAKTSKPVKAENEEQLEKYTRGNQERLRGRGSI